MVGTGAREKEDRGQVVDVERVGKPRRRRSFQKIDNAPSFGERWQ